MLFRSAFITGASSSIGRADVAELDVRAGPSEITVFLERAR